MSDILNKLINIIRNKMSNKHPLYNKANKMRITLLLFIDKEIRTKAKNQSKNFENPFISKKEVKEVPTTYVQLEETFSSRNSLENYQEFSNKRKLSKSINFSMKTDFSTPKYIKFNESLESSNNFSIIKTSKKKINSIVYKNKFNIRVSSKNYIVKHFYQRDSTICFENKTFNIQKSLNYEKYLFNLVNSLKIKKKQKYMKISSNKIYKRKK